MFLNEFQIYNSKYVKGAKKVSYFQQKLNIDREMLDLKFEKIQDNYELFFNNKGLLLHSVHQNKEKKNKIIYGYNGNCVIIFIMILNSETNKLVSLSEFEYDKKGRIHLEKVRFFNGYRCYDITQYKHKYKKNREEIHYINDNITQGIFYFSYDNYNRIIEEKVIHNEDGIVGWCKKEYDKDNNLLLETTLNEFGEKDGTYEYLPYLNGLETGYKISSKNFNYIREYIYTFNDRGDWVNNIISDEGVPRFVFDRTIEYY